MAEPPLSSRNPQEPRFSAPEQWIRDAAELPKLDPKLRRRILEAAVQAQSGGWMRTWSQIAVAAVFLLGATVALSGYALTVKRSISQRERVAVPDAEEGAFESEADRAADEWSMVEDSFETRERNGRILKGAFWNDSD